MRPRFKLDNADNARGFLRVLFFRLIVKIMNELFGENPENSLQGTYALSNRARIPTFGFGTYLSEDGEVAYDAVREALRIGYRLIDTASAYDNEASVGKAVRDSGVPRSEIFVTSKLWNADQGYDSALKAFDTTMETLGLDYLDLYLIHWPITKGHRHDWAQLNRDSWLAMEELYAAGRIRAIGVSNFKQHHIESLMQTAKITPMVNQIEIHPGFNQDDTVRYCNDAGIVVEAWSPLGRGESLKNKALQKIASGYQKSVAQICLRWLLQKEIIPLPKSVTPARIAENADVFDFTLSAREMQQISAMDTPGGGWDSDKVAY